ncbi:MAG: hypothetical protein AB7E95_10990 [Kiritimatiellales bacterium]
MWKKRKRIEADDLPGAAACQAAQTCHAFRKIIGCLLAAAVLLVAGLLVLLL